MGLEKENYKKVNIQNYYMKEILSKEKKKEMEYYIMRMEKEYFMMVHLKPMIYMVKVLYIILIILKKLKEYLIL